MATRALVAIIAYNEAPNLGPVIEEFRTHSNHDVVVIDNGSTDSTADVARRLGVPCVTHCTNSGSSMGTVKTYFKYASRFGYEALCQFDGDGQHDPRYLDAVIDPVLNGEADYVIGSRFVRKEGFQSSALRRVGINLFSVLATRIIGMPITDITSGLRAYSRSVTDLFARAYAHELYDTSQLLLLSHYAGARILEVPVEMRARRSGQSEFNLFRASIFPFLGVMNVVGCLMQRRQIEEIRKSQEWTSA